MNDKKLARLLAALTAIVAIDLLMRTLIEEKHRRDGLSAYDLESWLTWKDIRAVLANEIAAQAIRRGQASGDTGSPWPAALARIERRRRGRRS